ncbi:hypothetical protein [Endozoicomonas euniceicola]|uniref:Uncharacterized protein n=1 Tax=Endozoicomonas euniceicola TaxID=1234143 RepID=A0ABY6GZI2_9GAMM|nr:hypothetical protein [Endozoicomonas euniceicola]UYM18213.1 hypothetical protein NX720_10000 [Endozoicomonas euniceicola]
MKFINRCVVSLKPAQPFIDWVKSLGADLPEDWSLEGGAYLLDEQDTEEALNIIIDQNACDMMENELSAWEEDPARWPRERNATQLRSWFQLHVAVAGFDLGKDDLMRADLADLEVM